MNDDVTFYRAVEGGKVHVRRTVVESPMAADLRARNVTGFGVDLLGALHAHWVARCGHRHVFDPMLGTIDEFADGELCWSCREATPPAERDGLFEHPTPDAVYAEGTLR